MARLCVTRSEWLILGRRAGLASAAVGICLATGAAAGPAFAASPDPIGYSPAKDVVAVAPLAVSITFGQPLRSSGAVLKVIAATGQDVGQGPIGTRHRTLRRALQLGAPAGDYTIRWTAVSAGGAKMSGAFSFTAARSNLTAPAGTPGQVAPSAVTASSAGATGTAPPTADATPSSSPTAPSSPTSTVFPASPTSILSATSASSPTPTGSPSAALFTASRPTWVSQAGPAYPGSPSGLKNRSLTRGFTAIPLAVAGLLVLSAALVARLKRRVHAS